MLRELQECMDLLDCNSAKGNDVKSWLESCGVPEVAIIRVDGELGTTDFVHATIPAEGSSGPTLGIVGRLGGTGASPSRIGLVSDADGAIVALSCAARLGRMWRKGDRLPGSVMVRTHVCSHAPIEQHKPVSFMRSVVDMATMNRFEVDAAMDGILSVDTSKGNWIVNHRGFAITPTVKEGYILRVSDDLLHIMRVVCNELPVVFPLTLQDITPYGNGIFHVNSILQPATATLAPVVGVATTSSTPIPGSATGVNDILGMEMAARFCVEVAKAFTRRECEFFDKEEFNRLTQLYGSMRRFQTPGGVASE